MKKNQNEVTMSNIRWVTPYNFKKGKGLVNKLPSLTAPDRTMPLVELIDKFASGHSYEIGSAVYYHGETDRRGDGMEYEDDVLSGLKWDSLDIVEKHQILADSKVHMDKVMQGIEISKKKLREHAEKLQKDREERNKKFDEWEKNQSQSTT